jgi:metal-responsive CopG/Arc/MetJ family transcriptional regulator
VPHPVKTRPPNTKFIQVTVQLPGELARRLDRRVKATYSSRSDVIRQAIDFFLQQSSLPRTVAQEQLPQTEQEATHGERERAG